MLIRIHDRDVDRVLFGFYLTETCTYLLFVESNSYHPKNKIILIKIVMSIPNCIHIQMYLFIKAGICTTLTYIN